MNLKNSNKITFFNILSTTILQGLSFFTSPLFSRMLGTENYGIVSVYTTWVSVFAIVFSLQTSSTLAVARNEYKEEEQIKYQSSAIFLSSVAYLVCSVIVIIAIGPISTLLQLQKLMIVFALIQGFGQCCITFINTKFTYEFKADKNCFLSILVAVLSVVLSLVLIYILPAASNYWARILGLSISYGILGIAAYVYIIAKGKTLYNKNYWKFCLPLAIPIIFHGLSNLLLSHCDRIMLQQLGTNSMVGIYSLAYGFSAVLSTIWNALNNSWVPFYYEYSRLGQKEEMLKKAKNYLELFTVLSMGFVLLATEVYHIYAGEDYWEGTNLILLFSIGNYMIFLYSFPVNYEFFYKKTSFIACATVIAAICNIVLNYFMIQKAGIYGAAVATAISHAIQFIIHLIFVKVIEKKCGEFPFKLRLFIPYLLTFLVGGVLVAYLVDEWYIRWAVGAILGIIELSRIIKRKAIF